MRTLATLIVVCALASHAYGQGFDGERFVPATGVDGGFVLEHPDVPFHLGWGVGVFLNYADDPVVYEAANNTVISRPVGTAFTGDLVGSVGLFGRLELGVDLPVHFVYKGDAYDTGTGSTLQANAGLGDLRFVPKVALVRTGSLERHFLLSLAVPVSVPTGNDLAIRGDGGVTVLPELLFAAHFGRIALLLDGGYHYRSHHPAGIAWGDEIAFGGGVVARLGDKLALRVEIDAAKEVHAAVAGADFPVEAIGGLSYAAGNLELFAGASRGLTDGIGEPDFRIIGGFRYRHHAEPSEGFADSDNDGVRDKDDQCPYRAEDIDGFEDQDGCPDPDNDHDGIPDEDDECPELAGDTAHRGCPAKTYVKIQNGKIFIFGKVQFRSGAAEIDPNSNALLDQIAEALNANPGVKRVVIEGHTDNVGDSKMNQKLSEERARSVKDALEKRHVDGDRLETRGYGESRPIAPNKSPGGRQKNRRVEFVVANRGS